MFINGTGFHIQDLIFFFILTVLQNYELLEEGGNEYNVTIFDKFFSCSCLQIHKIEDLYNPLAGGFHP